MRNPRVSTTVEEEVENGASSVAQAKDEVRVRERDDPGSPTKEGGAKGALARLKFHVSKQERLDRVSSIRKSAILEDGDGHRDRLSKRQDVELALESFGRYHPQKNGNPYNEEHLIEALADFGIMGRTRAEKTQLGQVLEHFDGKATIGFGDFCHMVEEARGKIRLARHSNFIQAWVRVDTEDEGFLSVDQVMALLDEMELLPPTDREVADLEAVVFGLSPDGNGFVSPDLTEFLISGLREKAESMRRRKERELQAKHDLDWKTFQEFRSQLLDFWDQFTESDLDGSGSLSVEEIVRLLADFGLLKTPAEEGYPDNREVVIAITDSLHKPWFFESEDEEIDFARFLDVIRVIRTMNMEERSEDVQAIFATYDHDHSGELDIKETCQVLGDLGLNPKTPQEQQSIAQLMEEVDSDGSGQLDFQELLLMVQRICEKLSQMQRWSERLRAEELGFKLETMYALRDAFDSLQNGSGVLGHTEVERAMQLMGWRLPAAKIHRLLEEADDDQSGQLDFSEFLGLMCRVEDEIKGSGVMSTPLDDAKEQEAGAGGEQGGEEGAASKKGRKEQQTPRRASRRKA